MAGRSLDQYADTLLGEDDQLLRGMQEEAKRRNLPMIQVPSDLGRLLALLVRATGARRVLEIGTLFGYSGVVMARALPDGGSLVTLEANPKHAAAAAENFKHAGVADRVRIVEGDARRSLSSLAGEMFDLIFIDADKVSYPAYVEAALEMSHPGTVIVADNVWRDGSVTEPDSDDLRGLGEFNRRIARESRLHSTFVATREGSDAASLSVVLR